MTRHVLRLLESFPLVDESAVCSAQRLPRKRRNDQASALRPTYLLRRQVVIARIDLFFRRAMGIGGQSLEFALSVSWPTGVVKFLKTLDFVVHNRRAAGNLTTVKIAELLEKIAATGML